MMTSTKIALRLICFSVLSLASIASVDAAKPNFVIVIADDHGVYDSSVYGPPRFNTPNMRALADEGITMNAAYVASPSCAPSRAALFTGLMPYRNGIVGNHETELKPGVQSLLPLLIEQGYEVVFSGKVAHGKPLSQPYVPAQVSVLPNDPRDEIGLTKVEAFFKNRVDASRPLALFVGCTDTHTPWPEGAAVKIKPEDALVPNRVFDTPEARDEMARYMASIERVDQKLGTVRRLANEHLEPENTMVVYTSDHGMAWPFGKWSLYEAGIRTPFIAAWPGKIPQSSSSDAMISWIDVLPTLIDLAGGTSPTEIDGRSFVKVLFGETNHHRDAIFATHKGDQRMNVYPIRSVRVGNWKYIRNLYPDFAFTTHTDVIGSDPSITQGRVHAGHHWPSYLEAAKTNPDAAAFLHDYHSSPAEELYKIDSDPFEMNNVADQPQHADRLSELREMISNRMAEVDDDRSISGPPRLLKEFLLPPMPSN